MMVNKYWLQLMLVGAALLIGGCQNSAVDYLVPRLGVKNNYLEPQDFAEHLRRNRVEVGEVRPLPPDPFRASSACAIMVGDSEIGVYKYDVSSSVQKKRLEAIAEERRVYIIGLPYAAAVHGSFVIVGLDKNHHKHEIVRALRTFE